MRKLKIGLVVVFLLALVAFGYMVKNPTSFGFLGDSTVKTLREINLRVSPILGWDEVAPQAVEPTGIEAFDQNADGFARVIQILSRTASAVVPNLTLNLVLLILAALFAFWFGYNTWRYGADYAGQLTMSKVTNVVNRNSAPVLVIMGAVGGLYMLVRSMGIFPFLQEISGIIPLIVIGILMWVFWGRTKNFVVSVVNLLIPVVLFFFAAAFGFGALFGFLDLNMNSALVMLSGATGGWATFTRALVWLLNFSYALTSEGNNTVALVIVLVTAIAIGMYFNGNLKVPQFGGSKGMPFVPAPKPTITAPTPKPTPQKPIAPPPSSTVAPTPEAKAAPVQPKLPVAPQPPMGIPVVKKKKRFGRN